MHQRVMLGAQGDQLIHLCLTAVRPMLHMMAVQEAPVLTAGEAAAVLYSLDDFESLLLEVGWTIKIILDKKPGKKQKK